MDRYNNKIPFDTKFLHVGANSTNYTEAVWDARPLFIGPPDNITTIRTIIVEDVKEGLYKSEEIEVELSNLSIADVTLNPSHPVFNEPVNVTVTIKNNENETANATLWLYNVNTTDYEIPYCTAPKGDNLTIFYPGALNMAMHFKEMYIIPEDPQGYCRVYDENETLIWDSGNGTGYKNNERTQWGSGDSIRIHHCRVAKSAGRKTWGSEKAIFGSAALLGSIPITLNATETKNFTMNYNFSQPGVHTLWVVLSNGNKANKTVGGVDLAINLSVNDKVLDGDQLKITARIRNLGHLNATNFTVSFYNDSLKFYEESIPFLAGVDYPVNSTTLYTTWNATTWNAGYGRNTFNHTIKVKMDPCENIDTDESNNYVERAIQVYRDFAVTNLTISPDVNVSIGETITINSTIKYLGNRSCSVNVSFYVNKSGDKNRLVNSSILSFYASCGGDINWTGDIDEATNLTAWFTTVSIDWTADVGGNCTITVEVDPADEIWEANETNNRKSKWTKINAPDFVLENLRIEPASPIEGNTTNITTILKNTGDLSHAVSVFFYDYFRDSKEYNPQKTISMNTSEFGAKNSSIESERNDTIAMRLYVSFLCYREDEYLRLYDSKGRLMASYNTSFSGWTSWIPGNRVDVRIEKPIGSSSYIEASIYKYDYLMHGDEIENKTINLKTTDVQNITINWTATPAGEHRIVAIVDAEDVIPEINETNNVQMNFILVQGPDLIVSNIWLLNNTDGRELNTTNITAGELVNITANITNIGIKDANKFNVSFFLNDYDNKIGDAIPVLNLSPNQAINVSTKWNAAVGNHTIIVKADSENEIFETYESNNMGEIWAKVLGADLAVNITFNTTAEGDNAIITANATITNQGVLPANNFSSFLFFGLYKNESGCEVLPGYYGADDVWEKEWRWVNRSYAGTNYICVHVNKTWRFDKGKEISEVEKGDIKIYRGNEVVAEPTEPCCIPVMGDTVNVSIWYGKGQGVELFFYIGEINSTENVSLGVEDKFELSQKDVGKGIYTACVHADAGGNVTEHDERNNFEVKEIKVLPDFTVSNISIAFNGTEVKEAKEGEPVFINVSIKNEGLIRGIADVEVIEESEWIDISPRFELTPFGYPYGYGYVIRHPDADAIRVQFKTLNVTPKGAPNNDTRGVVYIRNGSGVEEEWWGDKRDGPASSSWITGDTIYVYAPTKCGDITKSNVVMDKYRWMKRIANFSDMELQAKETENITVEWNPDDAGPHTIRVIVDPDNETWEINETNNELNRSFHVEPCEDPAVVNITFDPPSPVPRDEPVKITAHITNYGTKAANFSVDLWALKEEIYHCESTHPTASYGETITTYPEANWTGIHFEKIGLDEGSSITRRMKVVDSHNNTSAYFHSFNGEKALTGLAGSWGGAPHLWTWVKGNAAEIKMLPFNSSYDRETTSAGGGRSVWGCSIDKVAHRITLNHTEVTLGSGNSTNVTGILPVARFGNGSLSYTIYAVVDRDNVIYEMSEANNRKEETLNIAIPDLTVSGVKCEGRHPKAVIENIGYAGAENVTVQFSRDVDTSDKKYPPFKAETDGNYSISQEGADVMRVHLKHLYVDEGGSLKIGNGTFWEVYEKDDANGFWSSCIAGDSILLFLNKGRYEIDKYEYGVDKPDTPFEIHEGTKREEEVPFTAENEIYNLTVFVDPENRVEESNEGNNEMKKMMGPDLTIENVSFYIFNNKHNKWNHVEADRLIADESHKVKVRVKNIGCVNASKFKVALYVNTSDNNETIPYNESTPISLNPGISTSLDFLLPSLDRGFYRVKAVVDINKIVPELDENDNIYPDDNGLEVKVGYPGYKAKEGFMPMLREGEGEIYGGIIYDTGIKGKVILHDDGIEYERGNTINLASDSDNATLITHFRKLPANATPILARLYVYVATGYYKDAQGHNMGFLPDDEAQLEVTFNGEPVSLSKPTLFTPEPNDPEQPADVPDATHWNVSYASYCYDVTYDKSGNNWAAAKRRNCGIHQFGLAGMALLVVYRDDNAPLIRYWIGEDNDVMMAKNLNPKGYDTGFEYDECTRKIAFNGVEYPHLANASLLTVLAPYTPEEPLYDDAKGISDAVYFNPSDNLDPDERIKIPLVTLDIGHWKKYIGGSNIALTTESDDEAEGWEYVDVQKNNIAAIQSRGSFMAVTNAILKVTYPPDLEPEVPMQLKATAGTQYDIPVTIHNWGRSKAKDFTVTVSIDGKEVLNQTIEEINGVGQEGGSKTLKITRKAPLMEGIIKFNLTVVVDTGDNVKELINEHPRGKQGKSNGEENNNITEEVTVVVNPPGLAPYPGGGGGTGGGWGEGTGTGEGSGSGEGIGTAGGSGESGAGESGGKTITGRLMKGVVVPGKEAGGGGEGEFSLVAWLIRLAMLAAAVFLVCAGYLLERRRHEDKQ